MKFEDYRNAPIEARLAFWINLPRGATLPPDWPVNAGWDFYVKDVCRHALSVIQELKGLKPKKAPWHVRARTWVVQRLLAAMGEVR